MRASVNVKSEESMARVEHDSLYKHPSLIITPVMLIEI